MCDTLFYYYSTFLFLMKFLINILRCGSNLRDKELVVLQVYSAYASFFYNGWAYMQVELSQVTNAFHKRKQLLSF